jgi:hypothetical protein
MLFKITFDKEIHVLRSEHVTSLLALKALIPTIFKKFPLKFNLTYIDEDSDEITLTHESDLQILLGNKSLKSIKIMLRENS